MLWPPSSQSSVPGSSWAAESAAPETLQPAGPLDLGQPPLQGRRPDIAEPGGAQRGDRRSGVDQLMAPGEARPREVEQVGLVLVDEPAALLVHGEVLITDQHGPGTDGFRAPAEDGVGLGVVLGGDHRRAAALEDPGLLGRDRLDRVAEILGMVAADRRHHRAGRPVDHVGGVEPAAEADFQEQHVGGALREEQERRGRGDLEHRDRLAGIGALTAREGVGQTVLVHEVPAADPADAHPLVESHEVRGGVDVGGQAAGLQNRPHERDGRALAVGAGDVDHGRQAALRMVQPREQPLDAAERQVDGAGVERQEARHQGVGRGHRRAQAASEAAAGAPAWDTLVRRLQRRAIVSLSWCRWTT